MLQRGTITHIKRAAMLQRGTFAHIKRVALPQYGTLFLKQDYIVTNNKVFEASFAFNKIIVKFSGRFSLEWHLENSL